LSRFLGSRQRSQPGLGARLPKLNGNWVFLWGYEIRDPHDLARRESVVKSELFNEFFLLLVELNHCYLFFQNLGENGWGEKFTLFESFSLNEPTASLCL
jgi:hypothetical protein